MSLLRPSPKTVRTPPEDVAMTAGTTRVLSASTSDLAWYLLSFSWRSTSGWIDRNSRRIQRRKRMAHLGLRMEQRQLPQWAIPPTPGASRAREPITRTGAVRGDTFDSTHTRKVPQFQQIHCSLFTQMN